MTRPIAVQIDGQWLAAPVKAEPAVVVETRTVTVIDPRCIAPSDDVHEVTQLLARIVRVAQGLSRDDQFRVRELVTAASATLSATTRIDPKDQAAFQSALRQAARG